MSKQYRLSSGGASSLKEALLHRRRSRVEEFSALSDVSLEIPKGAFFGLIGHNGSGKSTLLKLLAGIHRPSSGEIVVDGRVAALLELGSGFHPELTGRENVYLNGSILGLSRRRIEEVMDEIVEFSGLGDFIDSPVKVYSSGMYVRLGFAISIHIEPDILLIDEVIAVGDEDFQRRCLEHMYELRRSGVTIVLVSHAMDMIEALCDQVAWLDHGRIQQIGTPGDVCRAYLDHVNQIEMDRAEAEHQRVLESTEPTDDGPDPGEKGPDRVEQIPINEDGLRRRGSGEVRLEGLEFFDKHGNAYPIAGSGEPLRIRIWHRASECVEQPVFSVHIHHPNGLTVAAPSTRASGFEVDDLVPGIAHVDLIIDRMPLMPGDYALTFEIRDRSLTHVYDAWEHAEILRVQPGASPERT
ncbi:MAG: ABC transporter ATP-binding protein, partial [Actinomycetota bacterium]|nr:ABC transporter ATP-binding protein [Actinomycetota bacterium]